MSGDAPSVSTAIQPRACALQDIAGSIAKLICEAERSLGVNEAYPITSHMLAAYSEALRKLRAEALAKMIGGPR